LIHDAYPTHYLTIQDPSLVHANFENVVVTMAFANVIQSQRKTLNAQGEWVFPTRIYFFQLSIQFFCS
jgi:hypothetical protein